MPEVKLLPLDPRAAAEQAINATFNNRIDVRLEFPNLSHFRRNQADSKCRGDGGVCFRTVAKTPMRLWNAKTKKMTASVLVEVVNPTIPPTWISSVRSWSRRCSAWDSRTGRSPRSS